jgi:hypothetical protein
VALCPLHELPHLFNARPRVGLGASRADRASWRAATVLRDAATARTPPLARPDGQNLGRTGDLVDDRPSDRTRVGFVPRRVQPNLNRL